MTQGASAMTEGSRRRWLEPLVPAYRLALALREARLRLGLEKVRGLRWPVVSIGSLSTGGSGKTPLTITLAKALAARGVHVDVLSRGYGRRRSALPLLVEREGTADQFGDEPLLIAQEAGVPVYVAAERYDAGLLAEAKFEAPQDARSALSGFGLHLLDDGFQHRQLARDVDILLLSRADLADRLLPAGNLREALRAMERAQVIAVPAEEPGVAERAAPPGWGEWCGACIGGWKSRASKAPLSRSAVSAGRSSFLADSSRRGCGWRRASYSRTTTAIRGAIWSGSLRRLAGRARRSWLQRKKIACGSALLRRRCPNRLS